MDVLPRVADVLAEQGHRNRVKGRASRQYQFIDERVFSFVSKEEDAARHVGTGLDCALGGGYHESSLHIKSDFAVGPPYLNARSVLLPVNYHNYML